MSTWISDLRVALALAAGLALAGCLSPPGEAAKPAVRQAALGGGAVILTAPRGYCLDPRSLRRSGGRVALLASCESLTGTPGISVLPALMTVSVVPEGDAGAPSPEGLARAVAPARTASGGMRDGLAHVQVLSGGEAVLPGGDPRHWRGARAVAGHLAGLALYAPKGSPLAGPEGRGLLRALSDGLQAGAGRAATRRRSPFAGLFPVSN